MISLTDWWYAIQLATLLASAMCCHVLVVGGDDKNITSGVMTTPEGNNGNHDIRGSCLRYSQ